MKTCTQCGETKPLDDFHRWNAGRDGHRAACKRCHCERARTRWQGRPTDTGLIQLICQHCQQAFTYEKTTGRRRFYCTEECKYQAGQAQKTARAAETARRCRCGSINVARVGTPVCPDCKKDARDPERNRVKERRRTLRRYGLTQLDWDALVATQAGRCAICRTDTPGGRGELWHIDHCHDTGRVRGLLCHNCNVGIGNFRDDPTLLARAIEYLATKRPQTDHCGKEGPMFLASGLPLIQEIPA